MYGTDMKHPIFSTLRVLVLAVVLSGLMLGAGTAAKPHFLPEGSLNLVALLPAPPANDSDQTKTEIAILLRLQRLRTPVMEAEAQADTVRTPFRFSGVLGPQFTSQALPDVAALFEAMLEDIHLQVDPVKKRWDRPRPFTLDQQIQPCVLRPTGASYPSAHSTFGHLSAIVLSAMVPEKAEQLQARGEEYGRQRMVAGVHYTSDVESGAVAAKAIAEALFKNPEFMKQFEEAKAHTRKVLGLAP